jgi:hypothetical protein
VAQNEIVALSARVLDPDVDSVHLVGAYRLADLLDSPSSLLAARGLYRVAATTRK